MHGLMMDYPLTLSTIFRRAESLFGRREIVSRRADKTLHRYTFADFTDRARRLATALLDLGIRPGDRVATLGWNHGHHLEPTSVFRWSAASSTRSTSASTPMSSPTSSTTQATARCSWTRASCRCGKKSNRS